MFLEEEACYQKTGLQWTAVTERVTGIHRKTDNLRERESGGVSKAMSKLGFTVTIGGSLSPKGL